MLTTIVADYTDYNVHSPMSGCPRYDKLDPLPIMVQ